MFVVDESERAIVLRPVDTAAFVKLHKQEIEAKQISEVQGFLSARHRRHIYSKMAEGKSKGLQKKADSSRHAHKAAANTKKGKRAVAPKRTAAVKQANLHKVSPNCSV